MPGCVRRVIKDIEAAQELLEVQGPVAVKVLRVLVRAFLAGPPGPAIFYFGGGYMGWEGSSSSGVSEVAQQDLRRTGRCSVHLWIR